MQLHAPPVSTILVWIGVVLVLVVILAAFQRCNDTSISCRYNNNTMLPPHILDSRLALGRGVKGGLQAPLFKQNQLIYIENVFDSASFTQLQVAVNTIVDTSLTRRNDSVWRQAGILHTHDLRNTIVESLYYQPELISLINAIVESNPPMRPTPCNDRSAFNVLIYNKPQDRIAWHFDPNHYKGTRITVLICIENKSTKSTESCAQLEYFVPSDPTTRRTLKMKPNSMLVFDGTKIWHSATGICEGDRRVLISLTYCNTCETTFFGGLLNSIKEFVLGY